MTTPTSWPFSGLILLNAVSKWTSLTLRNSLAGADDEKTAPVNTWNVTLAPTVSGLTQCAAVSSTCGEMISAVHRLAWLEPAIAANISTTAGSPESVVPLTMPCEVVPTDEGAVQADKTTNAKAKEERFIRAL